MACHEWSVIWSIAFLVFVLLNRRSVQAPLMCACVCCRCFAAYQAEVLQLETDLQLTAPQPSSRAAAAAAGGRSPAATLAQLSSFPSLPSGGTSDGRLSPSPAVEAAAPGGGGGGRGGGDVDADSMISGVSSLSATFRSAAMTPLASQRQQQRPSLTLLAVGDLGNTNNTTNNNKRTATNLTGEVDLLGRFKHQVRCWLVGWVVGWSVSWLSDFCLVGW